MIQVPKWLHELMKENGDLDENDMYYSTKVIPINTIPEEFENMEYNVNCDILGNKGE